MSEHAWVLENIASYNAGGLEADERERLEQHTATCEACAAALEEVRAMDRTLETIFAGVRPGPALEDRIIRFLRMAPLRLPMFVRVAIGAAAVLLVGVLGAGMSSVIQYGDLPFPGTPSADLFQRSVGQNNLKQVGLGLHTWGHVPVAEAGAEAIAKLVDASESMIGDPKNAGWVGGVEDVDQLAASTRSQTVAALDDSSSMTKDGEVHEWRPLSEFNRPIGGKVLAPPPAEPGQSGIRTPPSVSGSLITTANPDSGGGRKSSGSAATGKEEGRKGAPARSDVESDKKGGGKGEGQGKGGEVHYSYRDDQPAKPEGKARGEDYFKPADEAQAPGRTGLTVVGNGTKKDNSFGFINSFSPGGQQAGGGQKPAGGDKKQEGEKKPDQKLPPPQETPPPAAPRKIIIRSGEIEFEIESFDSAVATITKLIGANTGGFIATVNSEKLPNGKVRGSVVVRIPPDRLDGFVLDLRKELGKGGELKGQRIGSQDITKQYTDLESRLRAARAMEERLLNIIKTGKGEIKDLLQAEKELGVWRTKIEEIEGELRYYGNLVALSTLTITLTEKEIRAPYAISETERIQMGLEVEDVEKAQQAALAAVAEVKGRVTKSELKQLAAGQFNAVLYFEVAPESVGLMRDRFKQLGTLARLEIDRLQQTEGGSGRPQDAKVKRNDSQFQVSLYNLANVAPRETVHINLACVDTEAVYKKILGRVEKALGRVVTSNLNQQRSDQTTGTIAFEVKSAEAEAVLAEIKELGEVMRLQVTENPDTQNVTRSKRAFNVQLWALGQVAPRETATMQLATRDVPAAYRKLQEALAKAKGRVLNAQLNEQDKRNITAQLDFEVRRAEEAGMAAALTANGDIYSRSVVRAPDNENVVDSKVLWKVSLLNAANIPSRETYVLGIEVENVEKTVNLLTSLAADLKGRMSEPQINIAKERTGEVNALLVFNVPLGSAPGLVEKFKSVGLVRAQKSMANLQVPDSELAIARISVTLSNTPLIVASDEGVWLQVRRGLSWSFKALALSLSWLIVGVCVVLPWTLLVYGIFRVVRRTRRPVGPVTPAA
jgi:hypothetical protein